MFWASENTGCTAERMSDGSVQCSCNHLTHFAILLSPGVVRYWRERACERGREGEKGGWEGGRERGRGRQRKREVGRCIL